MHLHSKRSIECDFSEFELLNDHQRMYQLIANVGTIWVDIQDLTRFAIQAKGPDGKWKRKPLAYRESISVHLRVTRPPEICSLLGCWIE